MKNTKKTSKAAAPKTYRESILKPGAARIQLTGRNWPCNPYLGGTEDEACIFVNEAEARAEVEILSKNQSARAIRFWEIHTLRADGLWQGCVAAGEFPEPSA